MQTRIKAAHLIIIFAIVGAVAVTGCSVSGSPSEASPAAITPQTPTQEFALLDSAQLVDALLPVDAMPAGFSADETKTKPGKVSSYCDYISKMKLPEATVYASRDYSKGSGLNAVLARATLRQYPSVDAAQQQFDALVETMKTCTKGDNNGEPAKFSVVSNSQVGQGSIVIKSEMKSATIYSGFSLNGPTLVATANGGVTGSDPDLTISLLPKQVTRYVEAATT